MMKGNNECTVTGTAIRLYIRNGGGYFFLLVEATPHFVSSFSPTDFPLFYFSPSATAPRRSATRRVRNLLLTDTTTDLLYLPEFLSTY